MIEFIKGSRKELEALRAKISSSLGYPKQPDFVGRFCAPGIGVTEHEQPIFDAPDGNALLPIDAKILDLSADKLTVKIDADAKAILQTKLATKVTRPVEWDTPVSPIAEAVKEEPAAEPKTEDPVVASDPPVEVAVIK